MHAHLILHLSYEDRHNVLQVPGLHALPASSTTTDMVLAKFAFHSTMCDAALLLLLPQAEDVTLEVE